MTQGVLAGCSLLRDPLYLHWLWLWDCQEIGMHFQIFHNVTQIFTVQTYKYTHTYIQTPLVFNTLMWGLAQARPQFIAWILLFTCWGVITTAAGYWCQIHWPCCQNGSWPGGDVWKGADNTGCSKEGTYAGKWMDYHSTYLPWSEFVLLHCFLLA